MPAPTGYPCPTCGQSMEVIDSRRSDDAIRRRRICRGCRLRLTTYERPEQIAATHDDLMAALPELERAAGVIRRLMATARTRAAERGRAHRIPSLEADPRQLDLEVYLGAPRRMMP